MKWENLMGGQVVRVLSRARAAMTTPGDKLSSRVMHAGAWAFGLRMIRRLLMTVRTVILARLLDPADFGLWAIAELAMALIQNLTQTGFRNALIQRPEDIEDHLDTGWTVEIIRNTVVAVLLVIFAPFADRIFDSEGAAPLLIIIAAALFVGSFESIRTVYLERELLFHKRFVLEIVPTVAEIGVGIATAFITRSAISFAYGLVAFRVVRLIVSYFVTPHRPRLRFEREKAANLFDFGKWVLISGVMTYLLSNLDYMVVGIVLGVTQLGFYRMAYTWSQLVVSEITKVVSQVAFPAYSMVQNDRSKLSAGYERAIGSIALVAVPISVGTALVAHDLTLVVLGETWLPIVGALQILSFVGLSRSVANTAGPMFQAVGRPDMLAKVSFARLVILGAIIYPFTVSYGLEGPAWAILISALAIHGVSIALATRMSGARGRTVASELIFPLANAGLMALAVLALQSMMSGSGDVASLSAAVAVGAIVYVTSSLVSLRWFGYTAGGLPHRFLPFLRRAEA